MLKKLHAYLTTNRSLQYASFSLEVSPTHNNDRTSAKLLLILQREFHLEGRMEGKQLGDSLLC